MRDFCLSQVFPLLVWKAEELMRLDLLQAQPWRRLLTQQLDNQVVRIWITGHFVIYLVAIFNVLVAFELGFPNKGCFTVEHLIQDNAEGPQVGSVSHVCVIQSFGCDVLFGADETEVTRVVWCLLVFEKRGHFILRFCNFFLDFGVENFAGCEVD